MKCRNGFVSNSSSSSFLVGFVKKPDTVEELRELLYGDVQTIKGSDGWDSKTQRLKYREFSTLDLAEIVFRDMEKPLSPSRIVEILGGSEYPGDRVDIPDAPEESDFFIENPEDPYNNVDWVAYGKARADAARAMVKAALGEENEKMQWYEFGYCDEGGGIESLLEHGGTFANLPGICISHH
jgi:hypothetical protein